MTETDTDMAANNKLEVAASSFDGKAISTASAEFKHQLKHF